jgi:copper transport protein
VRQRLVLSVGAAAAYFVVLALHAAPASAHALVVSSDPAAGQEVPAGGRRITLHFNERADEAGAGIRVLDGRGVSLDPGPVGHLDGAPSVLSTYVRDVPAGAAIVVWEAVGPDGHITSGRFSFTAVGAASAVAPAALASAPSAVAVIGPRLDLDGALAASRAAVDIGEVVFVGGLAFVALAWNDGAAHRSVRRLLLAGLAVALAGAAAALAGEAYATGSFALPATALAAARLAALVPVTIAALALGRDWVKARTTAVCASALLLSLCLDGHATAWRLLPLRLVHVGAIALWTGGLAVVAVAAVDPPAEGVSAVARRFAAIAPVTALAAVAAGAALALDLVPDPARWAQTSYGRVLLVKIAAVVALGVAASFTRRWVRRADGSTAVLRGLISTEVALLAVALVFAAVLAGVNPYA